MVDIFTHMRMVDFYGIYIRKYLNIPYIYIYTWILWVRKTRKCWKSELALGVVRRVYKVNKNINFMSPSGKLT